MPPFTGISDHADQPSETERLKYTVGWIAPMAIEFTPARALLECETTVHVVGDTNIYQVGRISNHHVVMVTLDHIGLEHTSDVASSMFSSFRNLKHLLLVGIGGGVPEYAPGEQREQREQIVLGDVVVGRQVDHLDYGRRTPDGFELTPRPHYPHPALSKAVNTLCSDHMLYETKIPHALEAIRQKVHANKRPDFKDLGPEADRLYDPDYEHVDRNRSCVDCCCDESRFKTRQTRGHMAHRETDSPKIHYGIIGSGNSLVVDPKEREKFFQKLRAICFEMEAAALWQYNCLVIRGICDYSDSHKNKKWQQYAAATAAAYAQELLLRLPAHAPGISGDPNQASNTNHEEPTASLDWVPPPSAQSADSVHQAGALEALSEQYVQEHHKTFEPSGTDRTLVPRVPKSLYSRCQSWIALTSQLDLYSSCQTPGMRVPISEGATILETFQASLARTSQNISGVVQDIQDVAASRDQIQSFKNILSAHSEKYRLSKFLFMSRGPDKRLMLNPNEIHSLRDRNCTQPLSALNYS
ncbi:MAG: hypothetical protein Q9168_006346 [Polycauliona sp. 1 TL-2023]